MKTTNIPLSQKINVQIVETAQLENVSSEDISPTFDDAVKAIKNLKRVFSLNYSIFQAASNLASNL